MGHKILILIFLIILGGFLTDGFIYGQGTPDLDCNNKVNSLDFTIILSCWASGYSLTCGGEDKCVSPDLNQDNKVDLQDLGILMSKWGYSQAGLTSPSNLYFDNITKTQARVNWTDNSNNEDGFYIYRSTSDSKPNNPLYTNSANDKDFTDGDNEPDLQCGTTYYYWIEAFNNHGRSGHINGSVATESCGSTPYCGDRQCNGNETAGSCPEDCGGTNGCSAAGGVGCTQSIGTGETAKADGHNWCQANQSPRSLCVACSAGFRWDSSSNNCEKFTSTGRGLEINPDNGMYFTYKGRPIYLIDSGGHTNGIFPGGTINYYAEYKINLLRHLLTPGSDWPDNPFTNEGLRDAPPKWNEAYWNEFRSMIEEAYQHDLIVNIILWGTPILEEGEGRWDLHYWNEVNGGPLTQYSPTGEHRTEFYTLDSYGTAITSGYSNSWSRQRKNQYFQDVTVAKYLEETDNYPNILFTLMWEISDGWGEPAKRWANHHRAIIKAARPGQLVGIGIQNDETYHGERELEVDYGFFEGGMTFGTNEQRAINKPLINGGEHAGVNVRGWGGYTWPEPDPPFEDLMDAFHKMILGKAQASFPFASSWDHSDESGLSALYIQRFMATVQTWGDEPGNEITSDRLPPKDYSNARKDSDGDGIPDWYEDNVIGLNKNNSSDASGDLDNDGRSNLNEYINATNPLNSSY